MKERVLIKFFYFVTALASLMRYHISIEFNINI
jgi:hypothetical protein